MCGGTFTTTWSDTEAYAEHEEACPGQGYDALICDVCYRKVMARRKK
jgi:hypothetical protein